MKNNSCPIYDFKTVFIKCCVMQDVLKIVSVPRRTIFVNVSASQGASIIKLSLDDRDLFLDHRDGQRLFR